MAQKINISQLKSKIRQIENKQRQAINKYNSEVRRVNQNLRTAINHYNNIVRQHNAKVLQNRRKIEAELRKLSTSVVTSTTSSYMVTVREMNNSYQRVANDYDSLQNSNSFVEQFYENSEKENANNLQTANILNSADDAVFQLDENENTIGNKLNLISTDLNDRWKGAVFSLHPENPDATRHFCTSAREIFTEIFKQKAPDSTIFELYPNCAKTQNGTPTYKAKIKYFLDKKGLENDNAVDFANENIKNVVELIRELSGGTHGQAGKYSINKLKVIKTRVEGCLTFLCDIAE